MVSHPTLTPEERFATIADTLVGNADVTLGWRGKKMFGATALKVNDKIFAMLVQDRFVVKLPRQRVDELVASGNGARFDPGQGRLMKEWVTLDPESAEDWLSLATEARAFVSPNT